MASFLNTDAATAPVFRNDAITDGEAETRPCAAYKAEARRVVSRPAYNNAGYLPGEENFIKTISTLSKSVDEQNDTGLMRASERIFGLVLGLAVCYGIVSEHGR